MYAALKNPKIKFFKMLSTYHGSKVSGKIYMPDFAPNSKHNYSIEVLGPIVEFNKFCDPRLRKIGSYGETKNGHSVLLRLMIGNFSVLFDGDLNEKAEKFLLKHYGIKKFPVKIPFPKKGTPNYCNMITQAAKHFRSDVMKVCHHGSQKVTDSFLQTVNPASFIISSGDGEGHVHPRPDLLGRLGRFGRGEAPVLLLTELQRSTREFENREEIEKLLAKVDALTENPTTSLCNDVKRELRN